jgi:hypothetical protein
MPLCKAALEGAGGSAAGAIPAHVAALSEGVVKAMLSSKLKNALALMTVALVLTASAGAWCYVAVAGQDEERPRAIAVPAAPKVNAAQAPKMYPQPTAAAVPQADAARSPMAAPKPIPRALSAIRAFQIDMQLAEMKDGKHKMLAEPRLVTLEGRPAKFACGDTRTIELGGGKTEQVLVGTTICTVIRSGKGDKITLDVTVSRPTRATFADGVILETTSVRHVTETTLGLRCSFAVGGRGSAPLVATVGVQELKLEMQQGEKSRKKPAKSKEMRPGRVGAIFIVGNAKTPDNIILEQVPLFPGQPLKDSDIREAERNLSQLKCFKSNPKVTVINPESDSEFKDIEITVEEK